MKATLAFDLMAAAIGAAALLAIDLLFGRPVADSGRHLALAFGAMLIVIWGRRLIYAKNRA